MIIVNICTIYAVHVLAVPVARWLQAIILATKISNLIEYSTDIPNTQGPNPIKYSIGNPIVEIRRS